MPRSRRTVAQLATLALVAGLGVLAPRPSFAVEAQMETDTSTPTLEPVPPAEAPPLAPADLGATVESAPATTNRLVGGESDIAEFVLIGVRYQAPSGDPAQLRVHTDGEWGEWTRVVTSEEHQPDAALGDEPSTAASDPIWIDHADGYELDLPADATGVTVYLVRESGQEIRITDGTDQADAAGGRPSIHSRSSWGARPYRGTPEIRPPLRRAIVHHTVSSNSYSPSQVPAMIRSVQAYHQDANGWDDIGYNFIVDRFGGIWEGRAGGITNAVVGAHAANHNTGSVGVSYLGEATSSVTSAALTAYGQLIGWKMFIHGIRPTNTNIIGHRNVGQTSCPGNALYNSLGTIRSRAASKYASLGGSTTFVSKQVTVGRTYTPLPGDFNADGYGDVLWYGPGGAKDYLWLGTAVGFSGREITVGGTYTPTVGDFDGDGRSDVFWYAPGTAQDRVWYGRANGTFFAKSFTVNRTATPVSEDYDGDGQDDVLWYSPGAGDDYLWYGTESKSFVGEDITVDGTYRPVAGDFNGDLRGDVFWYGPGSAPDQVWYGQTSRGSFFGKSFTVGGDFTPFVGDFNGGGRSDVFWYGPGPANDVIWLGLESESFQGKSTAVNAVYTPFAGDWNGDGRDDPFWYGPGAAADKLWLAQ